MASYADLSARVRRIDPFPFIYVLKTEQLRSAHFHAFNISHFNEIYSIYKYYWYAAQLYG